MALVRWEPSRELAALQNETGRWMGQFSGGATPGNGQSSTWLPAVDVWETEGELVVSFDLPGIPEDGIAVELEDNVLTVSGERERTSALERALRPLRAPLRHVLASVTLPPGVPEDAIQARYANGVLEVRVPKPEEQKPKRIRIGQTGAIEGTNTRKD